MTEASKQAYTAWQNEEERERLLMEQLPQVRYIARRIHERLPRHVPFEDLVHAGVVGLDRRPAQIRSAASRCSSAPTPNSAFAAPFSTACGKWTGARATCGARPGGWRRRTASCAPDLGRNPSEPELAAELNMDLRGLQLLLGEIDGLEVGSLRVRLAARRQRRRPLRVPARRSRKKLRCCSVCTPR